MADSLIWMLFGTVDRMRILSLLVQELGIGAIYALLGYTTLKICDRITIKRATLEMFYPLSHSTFILVYIHSHSHPGMSRYILYGMAYTFGFAMVYPLLKADMPRYDLFRAK